MCCCDDRPASPLISADQVVSRRTLSVAGRWVQPLETNWRKEIVKAVGNNIAPASDLVFIKFMDKRLQGSLDLSRPSEMNQSQLTEFSGKTLRRYSANHSSVSPLLPDHWETGG